MSNSQSDDVATQLAGWGIAIMLVYLAILAWLIAQCVRVIIQAHLAFPQCRPLWIAAATFVACAVPAAAFGPGASVDVATTLYSLTGLAFSGWAFTAKMVEVYYEPHLIAPPSADSMKQAVLSEPWW